MKNEHLKLHFDLIDINKLDVDDDRIGWGSATAEENRQLLESIEQYGLLEPLIVTTTLDGRCLIIDGHRRLRAIRRLGDSEVLCQVRPLMPRTEIDLLRWHIHSTVKPLAKTERTN